MDLWHGPSWYKGLDRFGRIVKTKQADLTGMTVEFEELGYAYGRDGNRYR